MPLPVAHALIGASVVSALRPGFTLQRDWRKLAFGAFLGILPDFDYLLNLSPGLGGGWHHGFTHSIAFSFLIGLLAPAVVGPVSTRNVLTYSLTTMSHPLLDFLFTESWGVELFWPFSSQRFGGRLPGPVDYRGLPYLT